MGTADAGIPLTDLCRIPAVLRHPDPVHRELARPAASNDHDLRRTRRAAAHVADSQRDRGPSWQLSADGDPHQYRRRHCGGCHLRGHPDAQSGWPRRACRYAQLYPDHRTGRNVRHIGRRRARSLPDHRRRPGCGNRLRRHYLPRGALHHPDHHRPQAGAECAGCLHRVGVLDLAVGADGSLFVLASADRCADPERTSVAGEFAAVSAGVTGFHERNFPRQETFSGCLSRQRPELPMSVTDSEAKMRDWTDKATAERLQKDVAAVKSDIAALTDQITDALNTFANATGKQARRGYKQARENMDSTLDDMSERGNAMMGAAQDAYGSIEETLEDAITQRPLATVGVALGIGFLIGIAWRR